MKHNPYDIVANFEDELCNYTGAPHAVAVSSCTIALEMICAQQRVGVVTIPKRTYASVPQAIVKAGGFVQFDDHQWRGGYNLMGTNIWDCAPRFTSGMYVRETFQCLSFHRKKILGHVEGGAILTDSFNIAETLRVMRHDGRPTGSAKPMMIGYHAVMAPGTAAELLARMENIAQHNENMPADHYPDLSMVDWNGLYWGRRTSFDPPILPSRPSGKGEKLASADLIHGLKEVRRLRAENNDNWMDLLEHMVAIDPAYFREWQAKTREKDMKVSEAMKTAADQS